MYAIAAGLLLLGAVCGSMVRLVLFLLILGGATVIAAATTALQSDGSPVLMAVLTFILLQVGYGIGIIGRAGLRALRHNRASDRFPQTPVQVPSRHEPR